MTEEWEEAPNISERAYEEHIRVSFRGTYSRFYEEEEEDPDGDLFVSSLLLRSMRRLVSERRRYNDTHTLEVISLVY